MSILITDPICVLIDPVTGDLPPGNMQDATGFAATAQGMRTRLAICAGEVFCNLDQGVRYRERPGVPRELALLGGKFSKVKTLQEFRANLLGDASRGIVGIPGLLSVPILNTVFDVNTRALAVEIQATTHFGDTPADTLTVNV